MSYCGAVELSQLSLDEKVGQILMVHFQGENANENARILVEDVKVGGIIYYNWSNGLHSPQQVENLSANLQKLVKNNRLPLPLLIAADQEGGRVCRLKNGFTPLPSNQTLGLTGDSEIAEAYAELAGQELLAVGINMNLAPVVDVNCNSHNSVIGDRSYGDNPEIVLAFGEKAVSGYKKAGIISTLKHFPGHGDVGVDSHVDLPVVNKTLDELMQVELFSFAGLASSADAIMTAHILVPALDPENCATLSNKTLTYLRQELGFQGVIISDSLVMKGVLKKCQTIDKAAIQALVAGCDMLILGGKLLIEGNVSQEITPSDVQRIHSSIVDAVKTGRVTQERLDDAVDRVLKLKRLRIKD